MWPRSRSFRAKGRRPEPPYHSPVSKPWPSRTAFLTALLLAVLGLAACGTTTFDPESPCTEDGRFPGAYPALEAALPDQYAGRPADTVDSGRNCEPGSLGTLAARGIDELRFAGAIWDQGSGAAVSHAVLEGDGLESDWVTEFYEAGARAGRRVDEVTVGDASVGDLDGARVDALNGESYQSVVILPGEDDQVRVVIVANEIRDIQTRDAHDQIVLDVLNAAYSGV